MDIYKLLKKDHDKVKDLLNSLMDKKDEKLLEDLKREVIIHSEAEEEVLYDKIESQARKMKVVITASTHEHGDVEKMLKQLDKLDEDKEWMQLFSFIKKSLEAHIEKEETDLFDLSKKLFSKEEASYLAEEMLKTKEKLLKKYKV